MEIIDMHAHAFPDSIAGKAMAHLRKINAPYAPVGDGTIGGLLSSMDEAGVQSSFVLNIATKPEQAGAIKNWAKEIVSDRIRPVGSVHPDSMTWREEIDGFRKDGIKGIKFQPMYQNFAVDEKRMFPIYEHIAASKMFVIFHAGDDIAFPGSSNASVDRIHTVVQNVPKLSVIAAHLGGWRSWSAVLERLCGEDVFLETSFVHEVDPALRDKIFSKHDRQRFLFGSDFPWGGQKAQIEFIEKLSCIGDDFKEGIFHKNISFLVDVLHRV